MGFDEFGSRFVEFWLYMNLYLHKSQIKIQNHWRKSSMTQIHIKIDKRNIFALKSLKFGFDVTLVIWCKKLFVWTAMMKCLSFKNTKLKHISNFYLIQSKEKLYFDSCQCVDWFCTHIFMHCTLHMFNINDIFAKKFNFIFVLKFFWLCHTRCI